MSKKDKLFKKFAKRQATLAEHRNSAGEPAAAESRKVPSRKEIALTLVDMDRQMMEFTKNANEVFSRFDARIKALETGASGGAQQSDLIEVRASIRSLSETLGPVVGLAAQDPDLATRLRGCIEAIPNIRAQLRDMAQAIRDVYEERDNALAAAAGAEKEEEEPKQEEHFIGSPDPEEAAAINPHAAMGGPSGGF